MNGHLRPAIFFANSSCVHTLVHQPKLIMCDEPTTNLDHTTGRRMMEDLRQVAKLPDRGLIEVTHDPRILEFCRSHSPHGWRKNHGVLDDPTKERLQ